MDKKMQEYDYVRGVASDEELELYKECFIQNGSDKTLELLQWNHQQNVPRVHSIYYAFVKGTKEIAAIYTYLPVMFRVNGKIVRAMQSFDTLTDQNHRGRGLFIKLASIIEQEEKQNGVALVYGFPNENSAHGFVKKLHFHLFGEVPFLLKPLRASFFLRKLLRKNEGTENTAIPLERPVRKRLSQYIREISHFGTDYDELYNCLVGHITVGVERDAKYMNWRYVDKPHEAYGRFGYYEDGQLKGVVVCTLKKKHGGKIGYLMELICAPEDKRVGRALMKFASSLLHRNGAELILAWGFDHSFNYRFYKSAGFYRFPNKLRPQKLGFIARLLDSTDERVYDLKSWYLSYSDSDTV